jgi:HEPN domain-containing protein
MTKKEPPLDDIENIISHWVTTSDADFETMETLYKAKSYNWSLFVGHISIEKLLKALYVKLFEKHAPPIHNLYRLAELCRMKVTEEYSDWLDTITSFNINTRYGDFKGEFYRLCTREYAGLWMERIKELRKWIQQKL